MGVCDKPLQVAPAVVCREPLRHRRRLRRDRVASVGHCPELDGRRGDLHSRRPSDRSSSTGRRGGCSPAEAEVMARPGRPPARRGGRDARRHRSEGAAVAEMGDRGVGVGRSGYASSIRDGGELHPSVTARLALAVINQVGGAGPYRPEPLRRHHLGRPVFPSGRDADRCRDTPSPGVIVNRARSRESDHRGLARRPPGDRDCVAGSWRRIRGGGRTVAASRPPGRRSLAPLRERKRHLPRRCAQIDAYRTASGATAAYACLIRDGRRAMLRRGVG